MADDGGRSAVVVRQRLVCPICSDEFAWSESSATCLNGHRFAVRNSVLCVTPFDDVNRKQHDFFTSAWRTPKHGSLPFLDKRKLERHLELLHGAILDVGAGAANIARSHPHLDITSADLVIDGILDLGDRAVVAPLGMLPFRSGVFDLVIAFEVLEHVPHSQMPVAIHDVWRVLRPGGHFLISVPSWPLAFGEWLVRSLENRCWAGLDNLDRWDHPHERRYRQGDLAGILDKFEVLSSETLFKTPSTVALWMKNRNLRRGLGDVDLTWADKWLPFEQGSVRLVVARKPLGPLGE